MSKEFICTLNKTNQDYDTFALWIAGVQADLTSALVRGYTVSDVTALGDFPDGQTVKGRNNGYEATVHHLNNSATSPYQVMLLHDTAAEVFENNEILDQTAALGGLVDNTKYITLAATAGDTNDTLIVVAQCYDDDGVLTGKADISGFTADVDNYIKVTVPTADRHAGKLGSGFTVTGPAYDETFILSEKYTVLEWVAVDNILVNHEEIIEIRDDYCTYRNNIVAGKPTRSRTLMQVFAGADFQEIWNNLLYGCNSRAFYLYNSNLSKVYNNTFAACANGIGVAYTADCFFKNNIINGMATADWVFSYSGGVDATSGHNVANKTVSESAIGAKWSTGTADNDVENKLEDSGANFIADGVQVGSVVKNTTDTTYGYVTAIDSATVLTLDSDVFPDGDEGYEVYKNMFGSVTFADAGGADYHLDAADTVANNKGVDLSLEFTDDIDGDIRTVPWSVGMDQIISGLVAYPVDYLRKDVISGYHSFLAGYVDAKRKGYDPLKLPDGTVF